MHNKQEEFIEKGWPNNPKKYTGCIKQVFQGLYKKNTLQTLNLNLIRAKDINFLIIKGSEQGISKDQKIVNIGRYIADISDIGRYRYDIAK